MWTGKNVGNLFVDNRKKKNEDRDSLQNTPATQSRYELNIHTRTDQMEPITPGKHAACANFARRLALTPTAQAPFTDGRAQ
jgi:hypothetical protein